MKKHLPFCLILLALAVPLSGQGTTEKATESKTSVVASTSWTAAFADLGGLDDVAHIAPANLIHPPEYEITVSDVIQINRADYFIYAGYERMMQSMGDSIKKDSDSMIQIHTNNSVENVKAQALKIAQIMGTEEKSAPRVARYEEAVKTGAQRAKELGLTELNVYCHSMQVYLAKDLGLSVAGTFGPGPLSAAQIAEVAKGGYGLIIDNIHNPIASPLLEVSKESRLVVWRNFPESGNKNSLQTMVQANIDALLDI